MEYHSSFRKDHNKDVTYKIIFIRPLKLKWPRDLDGKHYLY